MTDVFISYSRADKGVARALHELLTVEGWEVWFDPKIPARVRWEGSIREGLRDVKCVVVLWSPRSVRSKWVLRESRTALETRKLIPMIIEACKLPTAFAKIEAAEMQGWTGGPHPEIEVLTAGIARIAPPSRIDTVRPGFDTAFLGREIGLPSVAGVAEELKYLHFSVVMNPARRLAWYVAYNMRRLEDDSPLGCKTTGFPTR
jgi:TIR domain